MRDMAFTDLAVVLRLKGNSGLLCANYSHDSKAKGHEKGDQAAPVLMPQGARCAAAGPSIGADRATRQPAGHLPLASAAIGPIATRCRTVQKAARPGPRQKTRP